MHEVSVVSDIVSAILRELENYKVEKVEEVVLVVGEMTSLGQEQLEFAYEIVTKDTKLEGSKLVIENEKIRANVRDSILLRLYPLLPAKRASRLRGTATYLCPMK